MNKLFAALVASLVFGLGVSLANAELTGNIGGVPYTPAVIKLERGAGDKTYDTYNLLFLSEDAIFPARQIFVKIAMRHGKLPDGKTFRKFANTETSDQPSVFEGFPEVQAWSIEEEERGIRMNHVFVEQAALQVTFGKRKGKTISGTISLTVPAAPDDRQDVKPSSLVGNFIATLKN
jgi:hypothetical protein